VLEMDGSGWVDYVEMLRGEMCCEDGACADVWGVCVVRMGRVQMCGVCVVRMGCVQMCVL
jgi:hypothetical protein